MNTKQTIEVEIPEDSKKVYIEITPIKYCYGNGNYWSCPNFSDPDCGQPYCMLDSLVSTQYNDIPKNCPLKDIHIENMIRSNK